MELKKALERQLVFKTEYGPEAKVLGGLVRRGVFNRQRYLLDGTKQDDVIHERALNLGPVSVLHRSRDGSLLSGGEHEVALTLFGLFTVSNDKDFLVKLKAGTGVGVLKLILAASPARPLAHAIDVEMAGRAGLRFNLTRFIQDIQRPDDELSDEPEDVDLS